MNSIENLNIGPKNIIFASKISNNRVTVYLKNKDWVDEIMKTQRIIQIDINDIEIRRLVTPAKRNILSNLCPSIPHNRIEEEVKNQILIQFHQ